MPPDWPTHLPPRSPSARVSRRSLLEWLGKATVLALTPQLAAACARDQRGSSAVVAPDAGPAVDAGGEAGGADPVPAPGPDTTPPDAPPGALAFSPGSGQSSIFARWPVRTVDPQDLVEILRSWSLRVDGLVERPLELQFTELLALPRQDQTTDFHCVEGWSVLDVPWNGVHLSSLLERVAPAAEATHLNVHCLGAKYRESLPLTVALEARTLLAYGIGGDTLPVQTGFPLRLVVPRKYAYKSAKYVTRLELVAKPTKGFWEQYGYPDAADVPSYRLRDGKY